MGYQLDAYSRNVPGITDELEELLRHDYQSAAEQVVRRRGELLSMNADEQRAALAFLGKTEGQRTKALARLSDEEGAVLIIRARYLGLRGARLLQEAADLQLLPGAGYRTAAVRCAEAALRACAAPSLSEVSGVHRISYLQRGSWDHD